MLIFKLQTPKSPINQTHTYQKNQYRETIKKKKIIKPFKIKQNFIWANIQNPVVTTTQKSTKIKHK
jgi:hypothetical protein